MKVHIICFTSNDDPDRGVFVGKTEKKVFEKFFNAFADKDKIICLKTNSGNKEFTFSQFYDILKTNSVYINLANCSVTWDYFVRKL